MTESINEEIPVELDEEGQVEEVPDNAPSELGLDDDDDDDEPPPPPPPPLPSISKPDDAAASKKKKKWAIAAIAGVAVVAAVGLGLGLGLKGSDSDANASNSNSNPSGNQDQGVVGTVDTSGSDNGSDDGEYEWTTTTEATMMVSTTEESWITTTASEEVDIVTSTTDATTTAAATEAAATTPANVVTTEAAPATTEAPAPTFWVQNYDAVIIGAGWAGIRAAKTLLSEGKTNILILEANNYIGGRSKTINSNGRPTNDPNTDTSNIPMDVGCEWLYNTGSDMEETLVSEGYLDGALRNSKYSAIPLGTGQYYLQKRGDDGGLTTGILEESDEWMEEIWGGFLSFRENRLEEMDGDSYATAIDKYIDRWNWNDDESLQFLNYMEAVSAFEYAGDSSQLDINEIEFYPPGSSIKTHYTSIPGMGFGNIAAEYAQREEITPKVKLNAKVMEINSEEDGETTIVKYVENGESKAVKAKTVLVTASLGVLKAGTINFVPSLPAYKQESINQMGFGTNNKCTMIWDNADDLVWPADETWFFLITPDDETSGQWTTFFNPSEFKGIPTLTAWIGGDEALAMESQSDDEILQDVMKNLKAMFPSITEPDRLIISRWSQEENVRGSYSFPINGRDFYDDADNLAKREGRVWFAGEATGNGWATTMGAWNTGEKAALAMARSLDSV